MQAFTLAGFADCYKSKRVLITGHTGFKGSWLSLWLSMLGAEVYGYSLQPKTDQDNFVVADVAALVHHKTGDLRDLQALKAYVAETQPEIVFHLAAQALVLDSYKNPVDTFATNIMGTVNLLESLRQAESVRVAVNVTTDKCYENSEWDWGYRENDPLGGKDPYSASKACSELVTAAYRHSYFGQQGSPWTASARAGNVIGGGDWNADRIIPDYFRAYQQGETLRVRNAYATRPWQHVLEPLSGYLSLAEHLWRDGKAYQGAWNFGPAFQRPYAVAELIEAFAAYDGKGRYEFAAVEQPHEAGQLKLDISKATARLGWQPVLSFAETVAMTAEGYLQDLRKTAVQQSRIQQIQEYCNKAKRKNIAWSLAEYGDDHVPWQRHVETAV